MRLAMGHIHASVTAALPTILAGKLSSLQYDALGKGITTQIAFIVQNCKLDPEADEQLHHIIAGMTSGIDTTTGKRSTRERASGIHKIVESLNTYGNYFDRPNWQPIGHVAH